MKKVLASILVLVMLLSLAPFALAADHEPVTLRFYNYALSEAAKASFWEQTIADFTAANDWITSESIAVDYNSMISTFTNDLASGQSVDLIFGEASWVPALADGGFIQPLEQVVDAEFYDGYYDFALDQMSYDGIVYGAPLYYSPFIIFVNKDLVEGAGLSMDQFPTTLDELKGWIETLAEKYDGSDVSSIFGLTSAEVSATGSTIKGLLAAFGGTLIGEDGELNDLTADPEATAFAELLDFYKYLIGNGYTQENLKLKDYRAAFGAGNVVMYVDQSWGYAQIGEVDAGAINFTVSAPLPTTLGTYGTGASTISIQNLLVGDGMTEDQVEAANLFIQYCTSTQALEEYMNTTNPAFIVHAGMEDCTVPSMLEGASKGVTNVVSYISIPALTSVETQLATTVLNYTVNGMSLDEAIADYIDQANYYIYQ